jgi:hypothetical protein
MVLACKQRHGWLAARSLHCGLRPPVEMTECKEAQDIPIITAFVLRGRYGSMAGKRVIA